MTRYQRAKVIQTVKEPRGAKTGDERENQLHTLIERIVRANPNITAREAWRLIQHDAEADQPFYDHEGILSVVDDDCIEWSSHHGNEDSLNRKSFTTRLSKIKKLFRNG